MKKIAFYVKDNNLGRMRRVVRLSKNICFFDADGSRRKDIPNYTKKSKKRIMI